MGAGHREKHSDPHGPDAAIPDKLYFKIGEVSQLVGVQAHVLRYWEKEVPLLRPGKSASNQRRYRRRDVEIFREIKRLLYQERYTLAGARRRIMSGRDEPAEAVEAESAPAAVASPEGPRPQLDLRFPGGGPDARLARLRSGLCELIALAGEEP